MNSVGKGDETIYITHLPGLKKPVLAIGHGCVLRKVASFNDEESAELFSEMLNRWLGLENEVQKQLSEETGDLA